MGSTGPSDSSETVSLKHKTLVVDWIPLFGETKQKTKNRSSFDKAIGDRRPCRRGAARSECGAGGIGKFWHSIANKILLQSKWNRCSARASARIARAGAQANRTYQFHCWFCPLETGATSFGPQPASVTVPDNDNLARRRATLDWFKMWTFV